MKNKTKNSDIPVVMLLANIQEYTTPKRTKLKKMGWENELYHSKSVETIPPVMAISKLFDK
jgi:hypothetical protein